MEFLYNEHTVRESPNITDRWILSFMQSLIGFFETEMAGESSHAVFPGMRPVYSLKIVLLLFQLFSLINMEHVLKDNTDNFLSITLKYSFNEAH